MGLAGAEHWVLVVAPAIYAGVIGRGDAMACSKPANSPTRIEQLIDEVGCDADGPAKKMGIEKISGCGGGLAICRPIIFPTY
jgi:hypothetical protein